jgi:dTDP-glucose 4,6-dehydratase
MNALIIGGTGFFGKSILDSFIKGLLKRFGITQITILARNIDSFKKSNPELINPGVNYLEGDIAKMNYLPEFDIIIHAANSTNLKSYVDQPATEKINLELGVTNFCQLISQYNFNSKIVYCSSGAVYGKQPLHVEKIDELWPFNDDFKNISPEKLIYLQGKRYAELEIIKLGKILKRNVSIARCFAFSGKYLPKDQHFAYGNFIGQAERGQDVIVYSQDIIYRSYMEADDLVKSLFLILNVASPDCPIYNVGSDESEAIHCIAEKIAKQHGVKSVNNITDISKVGDRYVPNTDRLKKLFQTNQ